MAVHVGQRPVGEGVGGIREQLGAGDQRDPSRVEVIEGSADGIGAGDPRDQEDGDGGDPGRDG
jgi:hypothetical protein